MNESILQRMPKPDRATIEQVVQWAALGCGLLLIGIASEQSIPAAVALPAFCVLTLDRVCELPRPLPESRWLDPVRDLLETVLGVARLVLAIAAGLLFWCLLAYGVYLLTSDIVLGAIWLSAYVLVIMDRQINYPPGPIPGSRYSPEAEARARERRIAEIEDDDVITSPDAYRM